MKQVSYDLDCIAEFIPLDLADPQTLEEIQPDLHQKVQKRISSELHKNLTQSSLVGISGKKVENREEWWCAQSSVNASDGFLCSRMGFFATGKIQVIE